MHKSNIQRIMTDIRFLENIKHPLHPSGCTRHSYSVQDKEARHYILNQCNELGLNVTVDGVGNIRAQYIPSEENDMNSAIMKKKPILIGSHIDTVTSGGAYDGVAGVMCSLETIRVIKENNIEIGRPVELIIFAEEEGSNFAGTLLGSKALIGELTKSDLLKMKNDKEQSAYDVIKSAGFDVDNMEQHVLSADDIDSMIELHIEQGASLENDNYEIGIVQAIAGQRTYKIILTGVSNHAGSTRMEARQDPLVGASHIISGIQKYALNYPNKTAVATVGKIISTPNAANVIAAQVEFYVDIRDVTEEGINSISDSLNNLVRKACDDHGLTWEIILLSESPVVRLNKEITDTLIQSAQNQNANFTLTNSGAVHDSVMLAEITRVGMIFVPSVKGLSHCPEEYTKEEDIEKGCNILIEAVVALANR